MKEQLIFVNLCSQNRDRKKNRDILVFQIEHVVLSVCTFCETNQTTLYVFVYQVKQYKGQTNAWDVRLIS